MSYQIVCKKCGEVLLDLDEEFGICYSCREEDRDLEKLICSLYGIETDYETSEIS